MGHHFCVYGDAEPFGETGTRVWPKQCLVRQDVEVLDAWVIVDGIRFEGICVVGLVATGPRLYWERISYAPQTEWPGNWGHSVTRQDLGVPGKARWQRVKRRTSWARVLRSGS